MNIVDNFVADVLLPHVKKVMPCSELYDLFEKYCGFMEITPPHSQIGFGRIISERLRRTRRNGKTFYYCEVSPRVIGEEDDRPAAADGTAGQSYKLGSALSER